MDTSPPHSPCDGKQVPILPGGKPLLCELCGKSNEATGDTFYECRCNQIVCSDCKLIKDDCMPGMRHAAEAKRARNFIRQ